MFIYYFRVDGIPCDMCWDQNGKRLAITFKNIEVLVVFQTAIGASVVDCIPLLVSKFSLISFGINLIICVLVVLFKGGLMKFHLQFHFNQLMI